jgi:putative ABC transport system permease protein
MHLFLSLQTALTNLRMNKLRTSLTMLGVIIGVSAVIIMVSIVEGARAQVIQEFERLGSQLILVIYQPDREQEKQTTRKIAGLTMDDVRAIREQCDLVKSLSAEMPLGQNTVAHYGSREIEVAPDGVEPDFTVLRNSPVAEGRFLTDDDTENWGKVCVIGEKVRKALFGAADPVGKEIEIEKVNLTVVGVMAPKGRTGDQDADKSVLLPITTLQKRYLGIELVGIIWAQPTRTDQLEGAMDQIWECLMRRHDNLPGFRVDSQQNILNSIGRILTIFGLVLGGVAGLALLVGGIGIMNIMLVSVTERTREIGIRKAVGAKQRDILAQFLIESATVSALGGLAGIALGSGVAYAIGAVTKHVMKNTNGPGGAPGIAVHLPLWAVLGAFLFSAGVGVISGIYPAIRAARLDPIQALRHE